MRAAATVGACGLFGAVMMIWVLRAQHPLDVYVSGLGAPDSPVAGVFNATLLGIGICGALIAIAVCATRAPGDRLGLWLGAVMGLAGGSFIVASRVTCTAGCPLPVSPTFTAADATHVTFAVIGFAAACLAMLLVALRSVRRAARQLSFGCAIAVGVIALGGALAALLQVGVSVGATLEFIAATIALAWCGWFGLHVARAPVAAHRRCSRRSSSAVAVRTWGASDAASSVDSSGHVTAIAATGQPV